MSRDSAADLHARAADPHPAEDQADLRSLHEGIVLLARLEQVLVDMQLSLDSLSLVHR